MEKTFPTIQDHKIKLITNKQNKQNDRRASNSSNDEMNEKDHENQENDDTKKQCHRKSLIYWLTQHLHPKHIASKGHPLIRTKINLEEYEATWRHRLGEIIESHNVQATLALLLLVDVFVVTIELLLSLDIIRNDTQHAKHALEVLHIISMTILGIFCLEILLLLIAFGRKFFHHPMYIIDLLITYPSLIIELTIGTEVSEVFLLVRLWRVVRMIHGIATAEEIEHSQFNALEKRLAETERQLAEEKNRTKILEEKVALLEQRAQQLKS